MDPQKAKDETTTYIFYTQGPGGQMTESITVNVIPVVTIQITSPVSMQTITGTDIVVEGTISNALGNDTGVTVNEMM